MAASCTYELFPLAERPKYVDQCIALLNEEWPRSTTQRGASMAKTLNREPPMAFGLVGSESGEIIGHAKLCPLPDKPTGCWLEALVVKREFRGKGTGRTFMTMLESEARLRGYKTVYLSTHDKVGFYAKLGYKTTTPVLNFGANSKLFQGRFPGGLTDEGSAGSIQGAQRNGGNTRILCRESQRTPRMGEKVDDSSCPPPPPPVHGPVSPSTPPQKVKVYMWKEL